MGRVAPRSTKGRDIITRLTATVAEAVYLKLTLFWTQVAIFCQKWGFQLLSSQDGTA